MINTQGKLLISAFIAILVGVILIQPIADDIEAVKASSYTMINESVTLTVTTSDVDNETVTLTDSTEHNKTGTLTYNYLTTLTELRNTSADILTTSCNVTLVTGVLLCNESFDNYTIIYADYTYNSYSTGALANDELESFDACRNSTMTDIGTSVWCNVTLISGAVKVDYDNFTDNLAYIDYTYDTDIYVRNAAARGILTTTNLFFAIAILVVGVGFAIAAFKQSGAM